MMNYLLIKTGHEGIDKIVGLFDRDDVIEKIKHLRVRERRKQRLINFIVDLATVAGKESDIAWMYDSHLDREGDFYCVMFVDGRGAKCVCGDLGVSPTRRMFR